MTRAAGTVAPRGVARSILLFFGLLVWLEASDPISVRDFGAVGDGVNDDSGAIQKAVNALPSRGGILLLPAGKYRIRKTIKIGDGSISRSSATHNITILGSGIGTTADSGFPDEGASELIWDGPALKTMVEVNGPISAVRLEGIRFSARKVAAICLGVHHAYYSTFKALQCSDFTNSGMVIESYSAVPDVAIGANHNLWEQIYLWSPIAGATGLVIGSPGKTGPGILAVSGNRFDTVAIHVNGVDATGIELRFTDFDSFTQVGVISERGNGLKVSTVPGAQGFPGAIWFYQCSLGAMRPAVGGEDWVGTEKIFFWPWYAGEGARVPFQPWAAGMTSSGRFFGFSPW